VRNWLRRRHDSERGTMKNTGKGNAEEGLYVCFAPQLPQNFASGWSAAPQLPQYFAPAKEACENGETFLKKTDRSGVRSGRASVRSIR
jgi:hypothetical protein